MLPDKIELDLAELHGLAAVHADVPAQISQNIEFAV